MHGETIILLGPKGVGKSTQTRLLGARLKWPMASLDDVGGRYYRTLPILREEITRFEQEQADRIAKEGEIWFQEVIAQRILAKIRSGEITAFRDAAHFKESIELHALKHFLQDYPRGILELGAGHGIYEDAESLAAAKKLLDPYPHVIALLPDPDPERGIQILEKNLKAQGRSESRETIAYYLTRVSYRELAKHILYTGEMSPAATRDGIVGLIGKSP